MEQMMKIAWTALFVLALFTFWPLIVVLLAGLILFLWYSSWKTKKLMNDSQFMSQSSSESRMNADVFDAEYTEKEVHHE